MELRPIEFEISGRKLLLKIPKNEVDIKFVRSIQYVRWNKEGFFWKYPIILIDLFVGSFTLSDFGFKIHFVDNGRPAYHPSDLL